MIFVRRVSCAKGGTSASCWISEQYAKDNRQVYESIIKPFEKAVHGRSKEDFDLKLQQYWQTSATYYQKKETLMKLNPQRSIKDIKEEIGDSPWPPPANPYLFTRPCGLYHTMFKTLVPFTFSSIVWYQGEEDTKYHDLYYDLLNLLIVQWRKDLKEDTTFYIVQLPICKDRLHHNWSAVRKAQEKIALEMKHTHLVTSLDCGEVYDIHPTEKAFLGKRIGEIMNQVYYADAPYAILKSWKQNEIIVVCENTKELHVLDENCIYCDTKIVDINIKNNCLYIYVDESATMVSYGDENNFTVNLFNEVGYPVSPFKFNRM